MNRGDWLMVGWKLLGAYFVVQGIDAFITGFAVAAQSGRGEPFLVAFVHAAVLLFAGLILTRNTEPEARPSSPTTGQ